MLLDAWREWRNVALLRVRTAVLEKLPVLGVPPGGYRWVCENEAPTCRMERVAAACATLWHAPSLAAAHELVRRTEILSWQHSSKQFLAKRMKPADISLSTTTPLETAMREARRERHVALAIPCCFHQVGGGFLSGDLPQGLEETLCTQSTLFLSMREAARQAESKGLADPTGRPLHIPEDGVVLSPRVEVFRQGHDSGYAPLKEPVELGAVLSISMPSANRTSTDSPGGVASQLPSQQNLEELLEQKFAMLLNGANLVRAEVLVMADLARGLCHKEAALVGHSFGRALQEHRGEILEVVLTGGADFQKAVRKPLNKRDFVWRAHC
eukprot:gnl/TRDRNA2_/TRDRNA2_163688_c1_seq1.p1 gnl/TRDRNA2_/TRDRNA2_163688_c1~~gnl/TRDRNA2_/TRDRNA2_163688_c1_seq1.p1  ORF type:complete len:326 (-),score=64.20 gnl/TRDRNA2_/TRDRNA2_163688_c1_seq1:27-1004(-)